MKRFILLLFLLNLLVSIETNAQSWAEVGTTWHYTDLYSLSPYTVGPNIFEVIDTATIDGQLCQVITGNCNCTMGQNLWYTYEENEKVYYRGNEWDTFYLLYDFAAETGDTIFTTYPNGITKLKVIGVGYEEILGVNRKFQNIEHLDFDNMEYSTSIIEGIGGMNCLFPQIPVCDPHTIDFRCYTDANGAVHRFNEDGHCDAIIEYVGTKETEKAPFSFEITPNPVSKLVSVSMIKKYDNQLTVRVLNIQGNVILQETFTDNPINSSSWNSGIYFLILTNEKGQFFSRKFVKL